MRGWLWSSKQDSVAQETCTRLVGERMTHLRRCSSDDLSALPEHSTEIVSVAGRTFHLSQYHSTTLAGVHWFMVDAGPTSRFWVYKILAAQGFSLEPGGARDLSAEELEWFDEVAQWPPKKANL